MNQTLVINYLVPASIAKTVESSKFNYIFAERMIKKNPIPLPQSISGSPQWLDDLVS